MSWGENLKVAALAFLQVGDLRIKDNQEIQKLIEGNKLRLLYQRRPCSNLDDPICSEPDPPLGDFPFGWPGKCRFALRVGMLSSVWTLSLIVPFMKL